MFTYDSCFSFCFAALFIFMPHYLLNLSEGIAGAESFIFGNSIKKAKIVFALIL
jgi:hypothetical protein